MTAQTPDAPGHTPGPWIANDQHSGSNPWRVESDNGVYANDGWIIAECLGSDAEANARLIAAAPELLSLVRDALEIIDDQLPGEFPAFTTDARAAITRATSTIADGRVG